MVQANANVMAEIWERVRLLNAKERLSLASRILQLLEEEPPPLKPARPADFIGLLKMNSPPSDEEVARILEEERLRKYGE